MNTPGQSPENAVNLDQQISYWTKLRNGNYFLAAGATAAIGFIGLGVYSMADTAYDTCVEQIGEQATLEATQKGADSIDALAAGEMAKEEASIPGCIGATARGDGPSNWESFRSLYFDDPIKEGFTVRQVGNIATILASSLLPLLIPAVPESIDTARYQNRKVKSLQAQKAARK